MSRTAALSREVFEGRRRPEGLLPMFEGFRRNVLALGLSFVEIDDPETSEGVLADSVSNCGTRVGAGKSGPGCDKSLDALSGATAGVYCACPLAGLTWAGLVFASSRVFVMRRSAGLPGCLFVSLDCECCKGVLCCGCLGFCLRVGNRVDAVRCGGGSVCSVRDGRFVLAYNRRFAIPEACMV